MQVLSGVVGEGGYTCILETTGDSSQKRLCLGTGMWALTLGTHSGKEKAEVTSASVTTPFLKSRSSSSSDEHLALVKEKLHLIGAT